MDIFRSIPFFRFWITTLIASGALHTVGATAVAQIVPDDTLGIESSVVTPVNSQVDQIDGGAVRGGNLFHSFEDFNIDEGRTVNFTNPEGIVDILSRVTGDNLSNLFGTLGVLGEANLYFLNPNGIIFGPNSSLDIRGSFSVSTAEEISFGNGRSFSAIAPQSNGLLSMEIPIGLQYGEAPVGDIASSGNLASGEDLNFLANEISLQGSLQAFRNLSVEALDTVRIKDSVETPFLAQSGEDLSIIGQQSIDILALNHPEIPFQSGGNLRLVSDGVISADAYFSSGGDFLIQDRAGNFTNLFSINDPIIRANGDISFAGYTGASLQVIAGGSITVDGDITINAIDPNLNPVDFVLDLRAGVEDLTDNVSLPSAIDNNTFASSPSSGGSITVNGNIDSLETEEAANSRLQVNLDARDNIQVQSIDSKGGNIEVNSSTGFISAADVVSINPVESDLGGAISLAAPNGITASYLLTAPGGSENVADVELTSQFGPVEIVELDENFFSITGRNIIINTSNTLFVEGAVNARNDSFQQAGSVLIGEQLPPPSSIDIGVISSRNGEADGGDININTSGSLTVRGVFLRNEGRVFSTGSDSDFGSLERDNTNLASIASEARGNGGDISIIAGEGISVAAGIVSGGDQVGAPNPVFVSGGDITLVSQTGNIDEIRFGLIDTSGSLNAGNVSLEAGGDIFPSSIISYGVTGAGGSITLESDGSIVSSRAEIASISGGPSDGGAVTLDAQTLELNSSRVASWTTGGRAGNVTTTSATDVTLNDSSIGSFTGSPSSLGRAGDVTVIAGDGDVNVTYISGQPPSNTLITQFLPNSLRIPAGAGIASITGGVGDTGEVRVAARNLVVDGTTMVPPGQRAGIATLTLGNSTGNANGITVNATDSITLLGSDPNPFSPNTGDINDSASNAFAAAFETASELNSIRVGLTTVTLGEGDAGNVSLDTERLSIRNGAAITTGNSPTVFDPSSSAIVGNGGSITIDNAELVELDGKTTLATATFGTGSANDITIDSERLILLNGAVLAADTFDIGEAGDIALNINQLTVESGSRIGAATAGSAEGGNITIGNQESPLDSVELGGFSASDPAVRSGIFTDSLGGTSDASNITIYTRDLSMNNRSVIRATARGRTEGGDININLSSGGWLRMRNDGNPDFPTEIATSATENARGGDINLTAPRRAAVISAVLTENSDIVADADIGQGGEINENVGPVVGFNDYNGFRTPDNDFTAISVRGVDGVVNSTDDNPQEPPPSQPDIPEVEQVCPLSQAATSRDTERSTFTNIGHGGLPPNPNDTLSVPSIQVPWITLDEPSDTPNADHSFTTISEAQGWEQLPSGEFLLTSQESASAPVCLLSTSREG